MKNLLNDLYDLMEDRWVPELSGMSSYQECLDVRQSLFVKLQAAMGEDFCDKVTDITNEIAQMELKAAFTWGLRLGLALPGL